MTLRRGNGETAPGIAGYERHCCPLCDAYEDVPPPRVEVTDKDTENDTITVRWNATLPIELYAHYIREHTAQYLAATSLQEPPP